MRCGDGVGEDIVDAVQTVWKEFLYASLVLFSFDVRENLVTLLPVSIDL